MAKKYRLKDVSTLQLRAKKQTFDIRLIRVPKVRQHTDYACGVACIQSITQYAGLDMRQDKLIKLLDTTPEMGTDHRNMVDFLNSCEGISAVWREDMDDSELEEAINAGKPVICSLQAWHERKGEYGKYDYSDEWEDGHYAIAIGYDKENIYFMDPSTCGNYTYITREHFHNRWHDYAGDESFDNAGIIVTVEKPSFDPLAIISMN